MDGGPRDTNQIMETPTEFDLNENIRTWRKSLAGLPELLNDNLDEMEAHLRDSIACLETNGLSSEEAFWIATRRMGSCATLALEYGKINARNVWISRVLWMVAGIQVASVILLLTRTATGLILYGFSIWDPERAWLPQTGMIFSWVFLGFLIWMAWKRLTLKTAPSLGWARKLLQHPVLTSIGLILLGVGLQVASFTTAWLYLKQGTPTAIGAQAAWTALSSTLLQVFFIPVALVYLARTRAACAA